MRVIEFLFRRKHKSKEKLSRNKDNANVDLVSEECVYVPVNRLLYMLAPSLNKLYDLFLNPSVKAIVAVDLVIKI